MHPADTLGLHAPWVLYLKELSRRGSIREVARYLNVAPSVISRQLRDLELHLGAKLFERVPKGVRLTAAGEAATLHANQVIKDLERLQASIGQLRGMGGGSVSIAAIQASAPALLPRVIAEFRKSHPRVTFDCRFVGSSEVIQQVRSGEVELGISFNPPNAATVRHLVSVSLPFGIIVPPDHPLAAKASIRLQDLVDLPVLLPDESISTRGILDSLVWQKAFDIHPAVISSAPDFVVAAALHGAGVAFQTPVGVERELAENKLVFIPLVESRLVYPALTLSISSRFPPSFIASTVAESLRAAIENLRGLLEG